MNTPNATAPVSVAHMAALHGAAALALLALFAAADAWGAASTAPPAGIASILAGLLAGFLLTSLTHEWSHFFGALACGGRYHPVPRAGLFAFNWDFEANGTGQFAVMSVAGSLGSVAAVALFTFALPPDTAGRVALRAASWGSLVFAAAVEWPVLYRVWRGVPPLEALLAIGRATLLLAAAASVLAMAAVALRLAG